MATKKPAAPARSRATRTAQAAVEVTPKSKPTTAAKAKKPAAPKAKKPAAAKAKEPEAAVVAKAKKPAATTKPAKAKPAKATAAAGASSTIPAPSTSGRVVTFDAVSTAGLESSPVAAALAGLRANEARYFKNKYDHTFTVLPASEAQAIITWVNRVLAEREIVIESPALEATIFEVERIRWAYVFYESGLSINVLYSLDEPKKRAVGFKLSEGMDVPAELGRFKFARQKSKLAGTIRGSFFVIKGEY